MKNKVVRQSNFELLRIIAILFIIVHHIFVHAIRMQLMNPTLYGCGGQCYGLVQWYKGRFTKLKNYCGANYTTAECQVKYLMSELNGSYKNAKNALNSNQDVKTMTYNFCKYYEVPANVNKTCNNRANGQAQNMLNYVNNGCQ